MEKLFNDFIDYVNDRKLFVEGIAIADEKKVLLEHHFLPDMPRDTYSHTKSYTATAIGIAISQGLIRLDDRLTDYFPESIPENPQPELFAITLRHLLTMSSGFNRALLMRFDRRKGIGMPDYMAYMMRQPIEYTPGERFVYSTADSYLAGRMLEKATGKRLHQYLYETIFSYLGQGFPIWECDPQGHPIGGAGLVMKLTDMMKLGQLYLADGCWEGQRLVDSSWIREATKKQIDTPTTDGAPNLWKQGYGYQFWMCDYPGSYRADGAYGQITIVLPGSGLVVAVQCPEYGDSKKVKAALHERLLSQL